MRPLELPTQETLSFTLRHLPSAPARILEVGCGAGELALQLKRLGHQIVPIDSSVEAAEQAKELGVEVTIARWPQFEDRPFDAVLFTRSLHHIHPLREAVEQAHRLLKPSGLVVVEDFAYEEAVLSTIEWFYGVLSLLETCGKLSLENDSFAKTLLTSKGSFEVWRNRHDEDVNLASSMAIVLKEWFEPLAEASATYLYRYLCPLLEDGDDGYVIVRRVLEMEERLASTGAVNLIGRRFVGRRKPIGS